MPPIRRQPRTAVRQDAEPAPALSRRRSPWLSPSRAVAPAVVAAALILYLTPQAVGLAPALGAPAALVVLALGLWASGALPVHVTALLLFALATILDVAPPAVIFSGFAAAGLWLVFGGLVIAAAIETTGLGRRLAGIVVPRLEGSYRRMIYGTVAIGVGLAFIVPAAMGRIVILLPIFQALAREVGFAPGSRGATGILLAAGFGTFMPLFAILPANLPNMVLLGAMETIYGRSVTYGEYLLLHFPVLGLLKSLVLAEIICRLFPDEARARPPAPAGPEPGALSASAAERRLAAVLALALLFWATDWLHGISAGWVALAAGLLCLLPGMGLLDTAAFETRLNFSSFIYVGGMLGMVSLVAASGLGDALGAAILAWLPLQPEAPVYNFAALVGITTLAALATAVAGLPAVMTPLAAPVAAATDLPLVSVLMVQVIGFSTMLLPYQSAPLMVMLQVAQVSLGAGARLTFALGLATLALLVPLDCLWWLVLGYLS